MAINLAANVGRVTFQLTPSTPGSFAGEVVVGGYLARNAGGNSPTGFGAFCVPQTQSPNVELLGQTEYGVSAAGDLTFTLRAVLLRQ